MTERSGYRYYDFVMTAFVTVLTCSNPIGLAKIAQLDFPLVGRVTFGAGVLFSPIIHAQGLSRWRPASVTHPRLSGLPEAPYSSLGH